MRGLKPIVSAFLLSTRCRIPAVVLFLLSSVLRAQQTATPAMQPPSGSNWAHVKALPANTKVHIATDHGGKTCRIFAVSEETLTCAKGEQAGLVLQRAEIKHIKLTHHGRSALVGAAIGGGIGATAGAASGGSKPCTPSPQSFCLGNIGIGAGGVAAIFGVAGGVVGGAVGGATDMTRGSSIYVRP
jgi:hypothetical protein